MQRSRARSCGERAADLVSLFASLVQKCVSCRGVDVFLVSPPRSREKYCAKCGEVDRDRNSALNMKAIFVAMFQDGGKRPDYLGPDATQAAVAKRTAAAAAAAVAVDDVLDGAGFFGAADVADAAAVDDQTAAAPPTAAADDVLDGPGFYGAEGVCFD